MAKKTTPVYLKSEFWVTLVTSVSGLLMAFGVITPGQGESVAAYVPNLIGAVLTLLSSSKFVSTQAAEKVEVFRALCALRLSESAGDVKAQGVTASSDVTDLARIAGL